MQARKLLNEEITDLEAAVRKKEAEVASAGNPLIRKRFEDALRKLRVDLDMKLAQKDEMREMARRRKESEKDEEGADDGDDGEGDVEEDMALELEMAIGATIPTETVQGQAVEADVDEGDLFGPDDDTGMDIG